MVATDVRAGHPVAQPHFPQRDNSMEAMSLPRRTWPLRRCDAGEQHSQNAGEENAIKGSRAADRSNGRAEAAHLVEIGEI